METLDREKVYTAMAGKAIERGLVVDEEGESLVIKYSSPEQKEADHLHRQALRSLVHRLQSEGRLNPDSQIHTLSINNGFMVRVDDVQPSSIGVEAEPQEEDTPINGATPSDEEIVQFLRRLLAS